MEFNAHTRKRVVPQPRYLIQQRRPILSVRGRRTYLDDAKPVQRAAIVVLECDLMLLSVSVMFEDVVDLVVKQRSEELLLLVERHILPA